MKPFNKLPHKILIFVLALQIAIPPSFYPTPVYAATTQQLLNNEDDQSGTSSEQLQSSQSAQQSSVNTQNALLGFSAATVFPPANTAPVYTDAEINAMSFGDFLNVFLATVDGSHFANEIKILLRDVLGVDLVDGFQISDTGPIADKLLFNASGRVNPTGTSGSVHFWETLAWFFDELDNSSSSTDIKNLINSAFGIDLTDGFQAFEIGPLAASGILFDNTGSRRDMIETIDFYEVLTSFVNEVENSSISADVKTFIFNASGGTINLVNGVQANEIGLLADGGFLYDASGAKDPAQTVGFYETLILLDTTISASTFDTQIRNLFQTAYGVTFPLTTFEIQSLADFGVVFDAFGNVRYPNAIVEFYEAVLKFEAAINASADATLIKTILSDAFLINFNDGLSAAEIGALADSGFLYNDFSFSNQSSNIITYLATAAGLSPFGLIQSLIDTGNAAFDDQGFTYDLMIEAMLFLRNGNTDAAKDIFEFFNTEHARQISVNGSFAGFDTVYNTQSFPGTILEFVQRMGENAFVGLFAMHYYETTGDPDALQLAINVANWIASLPHDANGGIAQGEVAPLTTIFSTENNADAYALFKMLAGSDDVSTANKATYNTEIAGIENWLINTVFHAPWGLFLRGPSDGIEALDANTFTILAVGIERLVALGIDIDALMNNIEDRFLVQSDGSFGGNALTAIGFDFSGPDNAAAIGRNGIKWTEGTHQMVLVYRLLVEYYTNGPSPNAAKAAAFQAKADYFFALESANSTSPFTGHNQASAVGEQIYADDGLNLTIAGTVMAASVWVAFSQDGVSFNPFDLNSITLYKTPDFAVSLLETVAKFVGDISASTNKSLIDPILLNVFGIPNINVLNNSDFQTIVERFAFDALGNFLTNPALPFLTIADFFAAILATTTDPGTTPNQADYKSALVSKFGIDLDAGGVDTLAKFEALLNSGILFDNASNVKPVSEQLAALNTTNLISNFVSLVNAITPAAVKALVEEMLNDYFGIANINSLSPADEQTILDNLLFDSTGTPWPDPTAGFVAVANLIEAVKLEADATDLKGVLNSLYDIDVDTNAFNDLSKFGQLLNAGIIFDASGLRPIAAQVEALRSNVRIANFVASVNAITPAAVKALVEEMLNDYFSIPDINNLTSANRQTILDNLLYDAAGNPWADPTLGLVTVARFIEAVKLEADAANLKSVLLNRFDINVDTNEFNDLAKLGDLMDAGILFDASGVRAIVDQVQALRNIVRASDFFTTIQALTGDVKGYAKQILENAFGISDIDNPTTADEVIVLNTFIFDSTGNLVANPTAVITRVSEVFAAITAAVPPADQATLVAKLLSDFGIILDPSTLILSVGTLTITQSQFQSMVDSIVFDSTGTLNSVNDILEALRNSARVDAFFAAIGALPATVQNYINQILVQAFGMTDPTNPDAADRLVVVNNFLFTPAGALVANPVEGIQAVAEIFDAITTAPVPADQAALIATLLSDYGVTVTPAALLTITQAQYNAILNSIVYDSTGTLLAVAVRVEALRNSARVDAFFAAIGALPATVQNYINQILVQAFGMTDPTNPDAADRLVVVNNFLFTPAGALVANPVEGIQAVAEIFDAITTAPVPADQAALIATLLSDYGVTVTPAALLTITQAQYNAILNSIVYDSTGTLLAVAVRVEALRNSARVDAFFAAIGALPATVQNYINQILVQAFGMTDPTNPDAADRLVVVNNFLFTPAGALVANPVEGIQAVAEIFDAITTAPVPADQAALIATLLSDYGVTVTPAALLTITQAQYNAILNSIVYDSTGTLLAVAVRVEALRNSARVDAFFAAIGALPATVQNYINQILVQAFGMTDPTNPDAADRLVVVNNFLFTPAGALVANPVEGIQAVAEIFDAITTAPVPADQAALIATLLSDYGVTVTPAALLTITQAQYNAILNSIVYDSTGTLLAVAVRVEALRNSARVDAFFAAIGALPATVQNYINQILVQAFGMTDPTNPDAADRLVVVNNFLFTPAGALVANPVEGIQAVAEIFDAITTAPVPADQAALIATLLSDYGVTVTPAALLTITQAQYNAILNSIVYDSTGTLLAVAVRVEALRNSARVDAFFAAIGALPATVQNYINQILVQAFGMTDPTNPDAADRLVVVNNFLFTPAGALVANPVEGIQAVAEIFDAITTAPVPADQAALIATLLSDYGVTVTPAALLTITQAQYNAILNSIVYDSTGTLLAVAVRVEALRNSARVDAFFAAIGALPATVQNYINQILVQAFGMTDPTNPDAADRLVVVNNFLFTPAGALVANPVEGIQAVAEIFDAITTAPVPADQAALIATLLSDYGVTVTPAALLTITQAQYNAILNSIVYDSTGTLLAVAVRVEALRNSARVDAFFAAIGALPATVQNYINQILVQAFGMTDPTNPDAADRLVVVNNFLFTPAGALVANPVEGIQAVAEIFDAITTAPVPADQAALIATLLSDYGVTVTPAALLTITQAQYNAILNSIVYDSTGTLLAVAVRVEALRNSARVDAFFAAIGALPATVQNYINQILVQAFGMTDPTNPDAADRLVVVNNFLFTPAGALVANPVEGIQAVAEIFDAITTAPVPADQAALIATLLSDYGVTVTPAALLTITQAQYNAILNSIVYDSTGTLLAVAVRVEALRNSARVDAFFAAIGALPATVQNYINQILVQAFGMTDPTNPDAADRLVVVNNFLFTPAGALVANPVEGIQAVAEIFDAITTAPVPADQAALIATLLSDYGVTVTPAALLTITQAQYNAILNSIVYDSTGTLLAVAVRVEALRNSARVDAFFAAIGALPATVQNYINQILVQAFGMTDPTNPDAADRLVVVNNFLFTPAGALVANPVEGIQAVAEIFDAITTAPVPADQAALIATLLSDYGVTVTPAALLTITQAQYNAILNSIVYDSTGTLLAVAVRVEALRNSARVDAFFAAIGALPATVQNYINQILVQAFGMTDPTNPDAADRLVVVNNFLFTPAGALVANPVEGIQAVAEIFDAITTAPVPADQAALIATLLSDYGVTVTPAALLTITQAQYNAILNSIVYDSTGTLLAVAVRVEALRNSARVDAFFAAIGALPATVQNYINQILVQAFGMTDPTNPDAADRLVVVNNFLFTPAGALVANPVEGIQAVAEIFDAITTAPVPADQAALIATLLSDYGVTVTPAALLTITQAQYNAILNSIVYDSTGTLLAVAVRVEALRNSARVDAFFAAIGALPATVQNYINQILVQAFGMTDPTNPDAADRLVVVNNFLFTPAGALVANPVEGIQAVAEIFDAITTAPVPADQAALIATLLSDYGVTVTPAALLTITQAQYNAILNSIVYDSTGTLLAVAVRVEALRNSARVDAFFAAIGALPATVQNYINQILVQAFGMTDPTNPDAADRLVVVNNFLFTPAGALVANPVEGIQAVAEIFDAITTAPVPADQAALIATLLSDYGVTVTPAALLTITQAQYNAILNSIVYDSTGTLLAVAVRVEALRNSARVDAFFAAIGALPATVQNYINQILVQAFGMTDPTNPDAADRLVVVNNFLFTPAGALVANPVEGIQAVAEIFDAITTAPVPADQAALIATLLSDYGVTVTPAALLTITQAQYNAILNSIVYDSTGTLLAVAVRVEALRNSARVDAFFAAIGALPATVQNYINQILVQAFGMTDPTNPDAADRLVVVNNFLFTPAGALVANPVEGIQAVAEIFDAITTAPVPADQAALIATLLSDYGVTVTPAALLTITQAQYNAILNSIVYDSTGTLLAVSARLDALRAIQTGSALIAALQANAALLAHFNALYGTSIPSSGSASAADQIVVLAITGDPAFNQADFLTALPLVGDLYANLQANPTNLANFNTVFGTTLLATGAPSAADLAILFGVAGATGFVLADFIASLTSVVALDAGLSSIVAVTHRPSFALLYGIAEVDQVFTNASYRQLLFDITGGTGYVQADYLTALVKTADLYTNLQANPTNLANFNTVFGTTLASTGTPSTADLTVLFSVAGDAGFDLVTFIPALAAVVSLDTALTSGSHRAAFETFSAILQADQVFTNAAYRQKLFDIVGGAGYVEADFLNSLTGSASLLAALQANAALLADFNTLYGTSIPSTGSASAADTAILQGVVGGSGFNQADFLTALPLVGDLYANLQANPTNLANFNTVFGTTLLATGAPSAADLAILFGVAGATGFVLADFIASLTSVVALDAGLSSIVAVTHRPSFALLYGIAEVDQVFTNASYRQLLFDITGGTGYVQADYLTALVKTADLYTNLQANPTNLANFNTVFGTTLASTGTPSTADLTVLFSVAGDAGFDLVTFIPALAAVVSLDTALTSGSHRAAFETFSAILQADQVFTNAAYRQKLFDIVGGAGYVEADFLNSLTGSASLLAALQANAALLADFNTLYGTSIPSTGSASAADTAILQGVVGGSGFNQADFLTALPLVGDLYANLQANPTNLANFNTVFGTTLLATGAPSAADLAILFGVAGATGFVLADFIASLTSVVALDAGLSSIVAVTHRPSFALLYGIAEVDQVFTNASYRQLLFDITGGTGYVQADYLTALVKTADLYTNLQANPTNLANFNTVFGTTLASTGTPSTADLTVLFSVAGDAGFDLVTFIPALAAVVSLDTALTSGSHRAAFETFSAILQADQVFTNAAYRQKLFDIVGGAGYVEADFLNSLTGSASLLAALQANAALLADFNTLYGTSIPSTGSASAADTAILQGVVGGSGFNQADFLTALPLVGDLYANLQANPTNLANFNTVFGTTLLATGAPSAADLAILFGVAGATGFVLADFIASLTSVVALDAGLSSIVAVTHRPSFALLYGIAEVDQVFTNASYRQLLFDITGGTGYVQADYLTALVKTADLYTNLQANPTNLANFNTVFGTTLASTGTPSTADLTVLFSVAGDAGFDLVTFIPALAAVVSLDTALTSGSHRAAFETFSAILQADQVFTNAAYRQKLFDIVGGAGYVEADFLNSLTGSASLLAALQANAALLADFNTLYGTSIPSTGSASAADTAILQGVVGGSGFNQADFLTALPLVGDLYANLQANPTNLANFNTVFGTTLLATGAPSAADLAILFGVAGATGFVLADFIASLTSVVALDAGLSSIVAVTHRPSFALLYGIAEVDQVFTNASYRQLLFDITGGTGYVQADYLTALVKTADLYTNLQANPTNLANFNTVFGTTLASTGTPSTADLTVLFSVAGDAGFDLVTFIPALAAVVSLDTALTSGSHRAAFETFSAILQADQVFTNAAYRQKLFDIVGGAGYVEADFLNSLTGSASLLAALQANAALLADFNTLYGTSIPSTGSASAADTAILQGVVGGSGFNQADFLTALPLVGDLYANLQANPTNLANFNTVFGTTLLATGAPSAADLAILFGVAGATGFVLADFIASLTSVVALDAGLSSIVAVTHRPSFALLYGIAEVDQVFTNASYRQLLFDITGGTGYVQADYLTALVKTADLYTNLQANPTNLANFNTVFGTTLASTGTPSTADLTVLFSVAGDAGFDLVTFIPALAAVVSLDTALTSGSHRAAFETFSAILQADQVFTNAAYRQKLFDIVGGAGYVEADFLNSLTGSASLLAALQANAALLADFNTLYGTSIPSTGSASAADTAILQGVVGGSGFNQADFLTALPLVGDLYANLQANPTNLANFNTVFGTTLLATGAPSAADLAILFGVAGATGFVLADFIASLTSVVALDAGLSSIVAVTHRPSFALLYGIAEVDQVFTNASYRQLLFDITGGTGYVQADYLTALVKTADLYTNLQANPTNLANFNTVFGTTLASTGTPSTADLTVLFSVAGDAGFDLVTFIPALAAVVSLDTALTSGSHRAAFETFSAILQADQVFTNAAYRQKLFDIVGGAGYVEADFLNSLTGSASLLAALQANAALLADFNTLYGTSIPSTGSASAADTAILQGVVGGSGFNQADFLTALPLVGDLYANLQANPTNLANFNTVFGTTLLATGAPSAADLAILFGVAGATGFVLADFIASLTSVVALDAGLSSIVAVTHRPSFALLYGIAEVDQVFTNASYRQLLFDITGGTGYVQADYLTALVKTADLYTNLQANPTNLANFNTVFGTTLASTGTPSTADLTVLFSVAGDAGFDLVTFIPALAAVVSLDTALTSGSHRAAFETFSAILQADQVFTNAAYRQKLFDIVGGAGYVEADFLNSLTGSASLLAALQANAALLADFNTLYGTSIPSTGSASAADTAILQGVVGGSGFNQADFLTALPLVGDLYANLQANPTNLANFNTVFGTTLLATGAPSAADLAILFGVAGATGFVLADFIASLTSVVALDAGLSSIVAVTHRPSFALLYGIAEVDQVFTNASYRQLLFDITGGTGYVQADYLTALVKTADLYTNLQANPTNLANFNTVFGTTLASTGTPSTADLTVLFSVAGDAGFDLVTFIPALAAVVSLDTALTSGSHRAAFETFSAILQADQVFTNAAYRQKLFDIVGGAGYVEADFLNSLTGSASLLAALQANAALLADFNTLYGTSIPSTGSASAADTAILQGVVGGSGFNQADFLTALPLVGDLYANLQANPTNLANFNTVFGTTLLATGAPSAADLAILFGVAGATGFVLADFIASLTSVVALDAGLSSIVAVTHRPSFALLYGIAEVDQVFTNASYRQLLFDITGGTGYVQADYLTALVKTADLYTNLQANPTNLANFNTVFGTTLASTGTPSTADLTVLFSVAGDAGFDLVTFIPALAAVVSLDTALTSGSHRAAFETFSAILQADQVFTNAAYRQKLFDIVGGAGYVEADFLNSLTGSASLLAALQANAALLADFNTLYGTSIPSTGSASAADTAILQGVVGGSGFNQADFLTALPLVGDLYANLQANPTNLANFNTVFGTTLLATGAPSAADLAILFGVAGATGFVLADFIASLTSVVALDAGLSSIVAVTHRPSFALLYGIAEVDQVFTNASYRQLLFDITGGTGYVQADYLTALVKTADLYTNLQANPTNLANFNTVFGTTLASTGTPSTADLTVLFSVAGDAGFDLVTFIPALAAVVSLDTALTSGSHRAAFETFSAILQADQVFTNAAYRQKLFDIVGGAGYVEADFLNSLTASTSLLNALQANSTLLGYFNTLYGTTIPSTGSPSTSDLNVILAITGGIAYFQTDFLIALMKTGELYANLQSNGTNRSNFNTVYVTSIPSTGAPSTSDLTDLFAITGDVTYPGVATFTSLVNAVNSLDLALSANSARNAFEVLSGVLVANQVFTGNFSATGNPYRSALFNLVAGATYNEANFITNIKAAEAFITNINALADPQKSIIKQILLDAFGMNVDAPNTGTYQVIIDNFLYDTSGNLLADPLLGLKAVAELVNEILGPPTHAQVGQIQFNLASQYGVDLAAGGVDTQAEYNALLNGGILFDASGNLRTVAESIQVILNSNVIANFVAAVLASPYTSVVQQILLDVYGVNVANGVSPAEETTLLNAGILYDGSGNVITNPIGPFDQAALFVSLISSNATAKNILLSAYGIDLVSDGKINNLVEFTALQNSGLLYDSSGNPLVNPSEYILAVASFVDGALLSSTIQQILGDVFGIVVSDGIIFAEIQTLNASGILFDGAGALRATPLLPFQTIENFLNLIAAESIANQTAIKNALILNHQVDLDNGGVNTLLEYISLINSGILFDSAGNVRPNPLDFINPIASFQDAVLNSTNTALIQDILVDAFNVDVSDGIDSTEETVLNTSGILYDSAGNLRTNPTQPFEQAATLINGINSSGALAADLKTVLASITGIDLNAGGIDTQAKFNALNDSGILFDSSGNPFVSPVDRLIPLVDFLDEVNANVNAATVRQILSDVFNINILDGVSQSEYNSFLSSGILLDAAGNFRLSPILPFDLIAAFASLVAGSADSVELEALILSVTGVDLSDGVNSLSEYNTLLNSGILFDSSGNPVADPILPFQQIVDFEQGIDASSDPVAMRAMVATIWNVDFSDGVDNAEYQILVNTILFNADGTAKDPQDIVDILELLI